MEPEVLSLDVDVARIPVSALLAVVGLLDADAVARVQRVAERGEVVKGERFRGRQNRLDRGRDTSKGA